VLLLCQARSADRGGGRVLIGIGRVLGVGSHLEYDRSGEGELDPIPWERMVEHSIRGDFSDGFLLPYDEALARAEQDQDFEPAEVVAFAPEDHWLEFSYGSEHVSNDAAIAALVACAGALERAERVLGGSRLKQREWIDARLGELWRMRGPAPGLGAALSAFGIANGNLVAYRLAPLLEENDDPWPLVERMFDAPDAVAPGLSGRVTETLCRTWKGLEDGRRALIRLLSRFELSAEQATRFYQPTERGKAFAIRTSRSKTRLRARSSTGSTWGCSTSSPTGAAGNASSSGMRRRECDGMRMAGDRAAPCWSPSMTSRAGSTRRASSN